MTAVVDEAKPSSDNPMTWWDLTVAMLSALRDVEIIDEPSHRPTLAKLARDVRALVKSTPPGGALVPDDFIAALLDLIGPSSAGASRVGPAGRVRTLMERGTPSEVQAIARAIDASKSATFLMSFRDTERRRLTGNDHEQVPMVVELREGMAFPVAWPRPLVRESVDGDTSFERRNPGEAANPASLELRPWESAHVRFWDPSVGIAMFLELGLSETLHAAMANASPASGSLLVTMHPQNQEKDWEFRTCAMRGKEFLEDCSDLEPEPMWYRPVVDPADWIAARLDEPAWVEEGADEVPAVFILSLPEYAARPETPANLLNALTGKPASGLPELLCPGSYYVEEGGRLVNRTELWIKDAPTTYQPIRRVHDKQFPVEGECSPRNSMPRFTVYQAGPEHRVAVGICRDLLHVDVIPLLRRLGVNVVIAPTDSPDMETLLREANALAGVNQAIVVIPNAKALHHRGDLQVAVNGLYAGHCPDSKETEPRKDDGRTKLKAILTDWAVFAIPTRTDRFLRAASGSDLEDWNARRLNAWQDGRICWVPVDGSKDPEAKLVPKPEDE